MPDQLQLRGGTTAEHTSFTGASKEVTIDTTKKTAVVHDASTAGGNPLMREDGANSALINGSVTEPALAFANADADNGIYSPGDDQVAITTAGVERVEWGASEVVFNDGGEDYDFRIEGDTNANLFFVDASTDRIGIGTSAPATALEVQSASNTTIRIDNEDDSTATLVFHNTGSTDRQIAVTNGEMVFGGASDTQMVIDSSGRLLMGAASFTGPSKFVVRGNTSAATGSGNSYLVRGEDAADMSDNDSVGVLRFASQDDIRCAQIVSSVDGTPGASVLPGDLTFWTANSGGTLTKRMTLDASGNVGIGDVSPTVLLDLESANPVIRLTDSDATGTPECEVSGAGGDLVLRADRDDEKTSSLIGFEVDGTRHMTILSDGEVGIGTTAPQTMLHVADASPILRLQDTAATGDPFSQVSGNNGNLFLLADDGNDFADSRIQFDVDGSEAARIDSDGRLLINTAANNSEAALIQVQGNAGSANGLGSIAIRRGEGPASMSADDPVGRILFQSSNGQNFARIEAAVDGVSGDGDCPARLMFFTSADGSASPTERVRLEEDGQFNLFTDTNLVVRSVRTSATQSAFVVQSAATNTLTGTSELIVFADGDVQNTNNSYSAISDIKLKENIVDASSQWDDIKAVRVRNFNFKEETGRNTHTQLGVVAQEIELTSPGLVIEREDPDTDETYKSVTYSVLYMKSVKALQEAMERIETLEAKVAALEAQ
jgi:hypothetical protein